MGTFNSHCHLELGFLKGAIPPGLPFAEWLERLLPLKRAGSALASAASARAGLAELAANGTTAVADILAMDTADEPLTESTTLRRVLFREVIDTNPRTGEETLRGALDRQALSRAKDALARHGLSPHAPYTITAPLLRAAVREARARGQWLCIHAAETVEETELLLRRRGPLADFLLEFHLRAGWEHPGLRPVPWLAECGALGPRTLLAHCNDIDDEDIRLMRESGASAVVCPGTHAYFARGPFPLARLLEGGVRCYLGTDSLASNAALDMEREIALACDLSPGLDRDRVRELADDSRADAFFR
ncbi:MAG: amidohydrolase family protein [Candidatus Sumerlaeia bacterium]|nr:amidohydrolase family protein [Candidatus Sumerlaeia bacterium]